MASFIRETLSRLQTDSPLYFKKIARAGAGVFAFGLAILGIPAALPATVHTPPILATIGGDLLIAGSIMIAVAKLTCNDGEQPTKP